MFSRKLASEGFCEFDYPCLTLIPKICSAQLPERIRKPAQVFSRRARPRDPRDVARSRFSGSKLAGSEERGRVGSSMSCLCFATRNYQQRAAGTPCALAGLPVERGIRRIFMRARNERRFAYWRAAWSGSPSGSRACCSPF